jgi:tryptophanase
MKTIIEPFRIKAVEPLFVTTADEREAILRDARFNLFRVRAKHVLIDLLTCALLLWVPTISTKNRSIPIRSI